MSQRKEIRAGIGYTVGNIFIKGASFISLPIFTRLLSPQQFGIFNTYLAYESILCVIIGLGVSASLKNAKIDYKDKINLFLYTIIELIFKVLILNLIFIVVFSKIIIRFIGLEFPIILILLMHSFGTAVLGVYYSKVSLEYNYQSYLKVSFINTIGNIFISILLIFTIFTEHREYGKIIGSALPLIILGIIIFFSAGKKVKFKSSKEMKIYALNIGIPLIVHGLSQTVESQVDRIMITNILGSNFTGIYSFIYSLAIIYQILFNSTDSVWNIWFFEKLHLKEYNKIQDAIKNYINLHIILVITMMTFSKEIIIIISPQNYWMGIPLFIPIIIGMFFLFLYSIPICIEFYYKKTKFIAIATCIAAVINIITNIIFIPKYGYYAAAFTTLISYFISFIIHFCVAILFLKKNSIMQFLKIKIFIKAILQVVIAGIIIILLSDKIFIKYIIYIIFIFFYFMQYKAFTKNFCIKYIQRRGIK